MITLNVVNTALECLAELVYSWIDILWLTWKLAEELNEPIKKQTLGRLVFARRCIDEDVSDECSERSWFIETILGAELVVILKSILKVCSSFLMMLLKLLLSQITNSFLANLFRMLI